MAEEKQVPEKKKLTTGDILVCVGIVGFLVFIVLMWKHGFN